MKTHIFHGDLVVWAVFALLCIISLIEVYSAGSTLVYKDGNFWRTFISQATFLGVGTTIAWFVHCVPCRWFKIIPIIFYPVVVILLVWALVGGENINGGARWLRIPFVGMTFQPSELAKGVLITTVALILTTSQREKGADVNAFKMILIFSGIICGLIVTQNFSTAAMLFGVVCLMMIIGRVPWRQLGIMFAVLGAAAILGFSTLKALPDDPDSVVYKSSLTQRALTWKHRLNANDMDTSVSAKDFEVTDGNRQKVHARIAIARGAGKGVLPGNSVQRDFLSQAYSDFIFAIIGEELGIWGSAFVVFLYMVLLIRAGRIASRCERNFPAFLVMGLTMLMVSQAMLNMMVAVGLFPVTGQTLPMISRGGSSTVITCVYFGMILSISRYARSNGKAALENVAREESREIEKDFQKD